MEMSAATAQLARERGFRVVSEASLPPGRYQLRIAAAEEGANRSGSTFYDLDVPDFQKPGFVDERRRADVGGRLGHANGPGDRAAQGCSSGTSCHGPRVRTKRSDRLFAEFYENAPNAPPHTVELATTVRAEDGRVVFENREQRSSTDLQGKSGGYGYAVRFPLAEFAAGVVCDSRPGAHARWRG